MLADPERITKKFPDNYSSFLVSNNNFTILIMRPVLVQSSKEFMPSIRHGKNPDFTFYHDGI